MASKKPKNATAGEKIEMKRFGISLHDVRTLPVSKRVKTIDRAIARAVRKERERCVAFVGIIGTRQMTKENAAYCIRKGYLFP